MKCSKLVLSLLATCYLTIAHGQGVLDSLYIDSLHQEYYANSPLSIRFTNKSKVPLYVTIALEKIDKVGNWHLILRDILLKYRFEHTPTGNIIIPMPLKANKNIQIIDSKTVEWTIDERLLLEDRQRYRLKYRIRIDPKYMPHVENDNAIEERIIYSNPFYIRVHKNRVRGSRH